MKKKKKEKAKVYYKYLDIIRIFFCIAILLYHLNILKGGYLAVCSFFVLSGYLSCITAFKNDKFSLKSYYINRLLRIYLPLLAVVFITIAVVSLFSDIIWLNLKPETTSVLLGYNNFWQLSVNFDYFAHHINSPFMPFWYISILLQFDLLFPLIYILLKKIGDKIHKSIPCIITIVLSLISAIYFYRVSFSGNLMDAYYNTFARIFSLLFGLSLGFIHSYYGKLLPKISKNKIYPKLILTFYLIITSLLLCFVDANSMYFEISMVAISIITCRLIEYSTIIVKKDKKLSNKLVKIGACSCYEIYLIQYPIIFIFTYINIPSQLKFFLMIILIVTLAYFIHFIFSKTNKINIVIKIIKYLLRVAIFVIVGYGVYQYYLSKDHTLEMKQLEEQLTQNKLLMQQKQEEYQSKFEQEKNDFETILEELKNDENGLENFVTNLNVVGIGDSVMLGATANLYDKFPNGYFDAAVSRTDCVTNGILQNLKNNNMLGNPIIFNLGTNGECRGNYKERIMEICEDREVFWLTVTNDSEVHVNEGLLEFSKNYNNLHIIDWNNISKGHSEYFVADGIHLTPAGREAYVNVVYEAIYNLYLERYNAKKEEIIKNHEEQLKTKISFYGNDILLNAFEIIKNNFDNANFIINKDFDYENLKSEIVKAKEKEYLTYKIVFVFDSTMSFSDKQYEELIEICKNNEIYILSINEQINEFLSNYNYENVTVIDFLHEIENHENYMMADRIHLTNDGNNALNDILNDIIKN